MEFLMTYGWAILVVLAAIGALAYFGVLSPGKLLPERTVFKAPIANVDNAVVLFDGTTANISIAFRNNRGGSITIPVGAADPTTVVSMSGDCDTVTGFSGTYDGAALTSSTVIANGDSFILTFTCDPAGKAIGDKFKGDITFDYVNTDTTQSRPHSGSVDAELLQA